VSVSEHRASIAWSRGDHDFSYESYSRSHVWRFEGGIEVAASAASEFLGSADLVDPEEAFVASISSCHMLTFLALAARRRLVVESYEDAAVGYMEKNADGRLAVTRVVLDPRVTFGGSKSPSGEGLARLHHRAHEECFIANSVRTSIVLAERQEECDPA
jgi:organic hydroperoxide reductase OsmC/OhrA